MQVVVFSDAEMRDFGARVGAFLSGGQVIELVGDIGAGKTTFTKGLAVGLEIDEDVQSPTFTINRTYSTAHGLTLSHYDFYRLNDAGILRAELSESVNDPNTITVIEWAEVVADVLSTDTLRILIRTQADDSRIIELVPGGQQSQKVMEQLA